ncbi:MAG: hypothetical protein ABJF23_33580 [Bryobacteraceae bacterium]
MLVSTRRTPVQGIPNEAQAATASRSNRNSLQSFASRFSAAVASTSPQQTAAVARAAGSSTLERERSNSGTGRKQQLASAGAHRGDDTAGRNLLEIPMDQPPTILTAAGTPLASAAKPNAPTYDGPQDKRDGVSDAAGKVTATGAPSIVRLQTPVANQWGYAGEAAHNPYFITPSNPLRDGLVTGFSNWFEGNHVSGLTTAEVSTSYSATDEGAQEALRLVKQYDPGASLGSSRFGSGGGPWLADKDTREITLSNGSRLNAGLVLGSYYSQGQGVTARSDQALQQSISAA